MTQKHKGKVALVTGANKGIGFEVARQLGTEGITVLVGARNPQLGEGAAAKLKAEGADAHFIELDVTKPDTIVKAAERIRAQYGRLDILVNNAGVVAKGTDRRVSPILMQFAKSSTSISLACWPLLRRCCRWCGTPRPAAL
jgi:NAD(P)-dependent dehydrogenase (short-subunit alcohol dehydrogenase family)